DDLWLAAAGAGVAQQPEDQRGGDGAQRGRGQPVPDAEAVIGGEEAGREEARVVEEGAGPEEAQLARPSVAGTGRDGLDAAAFDLAELVGLDNRRTDLAHVVSLRWHYPVQVHAVGAKRPLSPVPGSRLRDRF